MVASSNGTVLTGVGAQITDNAGNTWQITPSRQISLNGVIDAPTSRVDLLAYYNGTVWQKNADNHWYGKTSSAAPWSTWTGATPPVPITNASPTETVFDGFTPLTDSNGNTWTIDSGPQHQLLVDGLAVPQTSNVVELAIINDAIWQENAAGNWWSASSPDGAWTARPSPESVWIGGGMNTASSPAAWSSAKAPQPNSPLFLSGGTMNIVGNALNGNVLHVSDSASLSLTQDANVTVDFMSHHSNQNYGPLAVTVGGHDTLNIRNSTASLGVQGLNISIAPGGTLDLASTSGGLQNNTSLTVNGQTATLNIAGTITAPGMSLTTNITGTGTLAALYRHPVDLEINGSVAAGITVQGGQDDAKIDHAKTFAGVFQGSQVTLQDLTATSYNYNGTTGVFTFYNSEAVVDTFRTNITGGLGYYHVTGAAGSGTVHIGVVPSGADLPIHS